MTLLERARSLTRDLQWREVIALERELVQITGSDRVTALGCLFFAYHRGAESAHDWHAALHYGRELLALAPPRDWQHLWVLQELAALGTAMRIPAITERYGRAFLARVAKVPEAQGFLPHVWRHMGDAALLQGRVRRAIQCCRIALNGFAKVNDAVQVSETRLILVQAYLKAGRLTEAERMLPEKAHPDRKVLWHAAFALLCLSRQQWEGARTEAIAALTAPAEGPLSVWSRSVITGEMLYVLARVAHALGRDAEAQIYIDQSSEFEARQGRTVLVRLVLASRGKGGDLLDPEASRGSGGYHPDARFTTGVG